MPKLLGPRFCTGFGLLIPMALAPMALASGGALASACAGALGLVGGGYGDLAWTRREYGLALQAAETGRIGCGFITWKLDEDASALDWLLDLAPAQRPRAVLLSFGDPGPYAARIRRSGAALICRVQRLVSRHRSSVGLRVPSKRIAALHRLPIHSVWAARCALRCAPMAARSLRHLIRDATLVVGRLHAPRAFQPRHGDGIRSIFSSGVQAMVTKPVARPKGGARNAGPIAAAHPLPEPKAKLTDLAYGMIEEAIVTLRIPPGSAISEQVLSEMTGVGRTPIREAIQRLAREHLIIVLPQRGLLVSEIDVNKQLKLLETRREIERLICRSAARRANDAERKRFVQLGQEFLRSSAKNDDVAFVRAARPCH